MQRGETYDLFLPVDSSFIEYTVCRPHAARFIGAILCASLNVLVPSHALKASDSEVRIAVTHLSAVAKTISKGPQSLQHFLSPTFDHLSCALMALSRLSELHMCTPQPLSALSTSDLPKTGQPVGPEMPAGARSTATTTLDAIEAQVKAALRQGPEVQKRVFQSSCTALGCSHDLLAAVSVEAQGEADVRGQLLNILTTVARHASQIGMGTYNEAGQQWGSEWGWDFTEKREVSARHVSKAGDAAGAALLLCQQLSRALALCSVARRYVVFYLKGACRLSKLQYARMTWIFDVWFVPFHLLYIVVHLKVCLYYRMRAKLWHPLMIGKVPRHPYNVLGRPNKPQAICQRLARLQ